MKAKNTTRLIATALLALSLSQVATAQLDFQRTITVGGIELITLRGDNEQKLVKRCDTLYERLPWILSDTSLTANDINIRVTTNELTIFVKNRLFVTITDIDAKYNQNSMEKQAEIWKKSLSNSLPLVKVLR